jgi:hypothetical protein
VASHFFIKELYRKDIQLAAFLATWIANLPMLGVLEEYLKQDNASLGNMLTPDIPITEHTAFRFIAKEYGYGYGTRSTSVYLSMAVLISYCIIVVGHTLYTLATGSVSAAWNSGVELITLALQSKQPDHLGHTGVGIDSINTLGESVGIRVNANNQVELVFAQDQDFETRGLRKLERNKEY